MEAKHTIHVLSPRDIAGFAELIRLFEDVFEMKDFIMPEQEYLQRLLEKPGFFVMIAMAEGKIIGGLTVYVLEQYYSVKPLAYIYDLAVDRAFQRKGVGSDLIKHLIQHCKSRGYQEIFVQADRADTYALDFYRSAGADVEEDVIHFTYSLPS